MQPRNVRDQLRTIAPFAAGLLAALVAANVVVARDDFPDYGTWTGIRPLEEKLRKLDRFASEGRVDGVVLGSSISDFGFSAETLSRRMSAARGTDYRAFNFSSGATELVTMPKLYRLLRTVAKPKTLFVVVPPGIKRSNVFEPLSPDFIMQNAPIGRALAHPWLLPADRRLWDVPLVRYGTPIRELLIFGKYVNLPAQGADLYRINDHGDTLSFSYQTSRAALAETRGLFREQLTPLTDAQLATLTDRERLAYFFNDLDAAALAELRTLTKKDDVAIVVVAHNVSSAYFPEPIRLKRYVQARRQFFDVLADELDARLVYPIERYSAPQSAVTDTVHLNRHGAEVFTNLVADELSGSPRETEHPLAEPEHPVLPDMPPDDVTVTSFAALVEAPARADERTLRLHLILNHAVPELPPGPLSLMARLPDGKDVVAAARFTSDETLEATFPDVETARGRLLFVRIVADIGGRVAALNQPISGYEWVEGE